MSTRSKEWTLALTGGGVVGGVVGGGVFIKDFLTCKVTRKARQLVRPVECWTGRLVDT